MMSCWGKELYLFYLPIKDSDDFIDQVERELIRVIIPPCNSNIPDHYILPEEKCFEERYYGFENTCDSFKMGIWFTM